MSFPQIPLSFLLQLDGLKDNIYIMTKSYDRISKVADKREQLKRELRETKALIRSLQEKYFSLEGELLKIEDENPYFFLKENDVEPPEFGRITARNERSYIAWRAILDYFKMRGNSDGLSQEQLYNAISKKLGDVPEVTLRSYLNRFKKKQLIEKQENNKWFLVVYKNRREI